MKLSIVFISLTLFCGCSKSQPTAEEELLTITGSVFTATTSDSETLSGITIDLFGPEQESLRSDTTDASGSFSFYNLTQGSYRIFINSPAYHAIDTTYYLSGSSKLEFKLREKGDYFPLALNNEWLYEYVYYVYSVSNCVGVAYKKYFGLKKWVITEVIGDSLYEFSERMNITELQPEFDDNGCVIKYDTLDSAENLSTFYLKEQGNSRLISANPDDLFTGSEVKRYNTSASPKEIEFYGTIHKENDYNTELGKLKKETGLVNYMYKFGSSSHHYSYYELHLIDNIQN